MYFDGKTTYVELPAEAFDLVSDGTFEAWVKWEKFNKWARVFDFGREKNAMVIQTEKTSSTINFAVWDQKGKRHRTQAKKAVRKGTWHHVAAVFGRSGMMFYLDGRRIEDYKTAVAKFREVLTYVNPYKDTAERAARSQRLADEAAALLTLKDHQVITGLR